MRVIVGRIGKPHGIRGDVMVEPRTDEPDERFGVGCVLDIDVPPGTLEVRSARWHSGRLLVGFDGVDDRSAAERLRGLLLHVERDADERPTDPDEYYDSQLVDCRVELADGSYVGDVSEVLHLPVQDLLAVSTDTGREHLIPFVSSIVPVVDVAARRIVISPPAGLLEDA